MATLQQMERALVAADRAGDMDAARKLAAAIRVARRDVGALIPTEPTPAQAAAGAVAPVAPPATAPIQPDSPMTLGQVITGPLEAGATLLTGATTGALGAAASGVREMGKQLFSGQFGTAQAADAVERAVVEGADAFTYSPRTPAGQSIVGAIGSAAQGLLPVLPLAGPGSAAAALAGPSAAQARAAAAPVAARAAEGLRAAGGAAAEALESLRRPSEASPRAAGGSVGAAGTSLSAMRAAMANELPVPPQLTKGQRARTYAAQQEEELLAKDAKIGDPIRQRYNDQRQALIQNMDAFFDQTGARLGTLGDVGTAVDQTLRSALAKEKARVRTLYREAEKAGELEAPVTLSRLADFFNANTAEAQVANVIGAARQKGINLGLFVEDANGNLSARPVTLRDGELFRRSVNNLTNHEPTNIKFASDIKRIYDESTESIAEQGATLYAKARKARREMAEQFELNELTRNLINNKRGTADRAVAFEDVLHKLVFSPSTSLDSLKHVARILKAQGSSGAQTWAEIRGATIRHLQERALSNVGRDERGTRIFSAAKFDADLRTLERGGKLEYIFGKRGAEQLRTLSEVAKVVLNPIPGTVNTSNTATMLAGMMDLFMASGTGIPMPALTSFRIIREQVQDRRLRARVDEMLAP